MGYFSVFLIAVSLAMDALAVSVTNGIVISDFKRRHAVRMGAYFGVFQFFMPVIGYYLGTGFEVYIKQIDHWIAFGLLSIIGVNMVVESFRPEETQAVGVSAKEALSVKNMLMQAIATSIDALAVGISFAVVGGGNIFIYSFIIGAVAFTISYFGGIFGRKIGDVFRKSAGRIGGCVLIFIGIKILVEHMLG